MQNAANYLKHSSSPGLTSGACTPVLEAPNPIIRHLSLRLSSCGIVRRSLRHCPASKPQSTSAPGKAPHAKLGLAAIVRNPAPGSSHAPFLHPSSSPTFVLKTYPGRRRRRRLRHLLQEGLPQAGHQPLELQAPGLPPCRPHRLGRICDVACFKSGGRVRLGQRLRPRLTHSPPARWAAGSGAAAVPRRRRLGCGCAAGVVCAGRGVCGQPMTVHMEGKEEEHHCCPSGQMASDEPAG